MDALGDLLNTNLAGGVILALVLIIFRMVERGSDRKTLNGYASIERATLDKLAQAMEDIRDANRMTSMTVGRLLENDADKFKLLREIRDRCMWHVSRGRVSDDKD